MSNIFEDWGFCRPLTPAEEEQHRREGQSIVGGCMGAVVLIVAALIGFGYWLHS